MRKKLTVPVRAVGGDACVGTIAAGSLRMVADDVEEVVIEQCGHSVAEDRPERLIERLEAFLGEGSG